MDNEPPLTLIDAERARDAARRLFEAVSKSLGAMLPPRVDIRHIGATAVPGCLTKGDLDIVVRVPVEDFETADGMLASRYSRNDGSIRTATFSAFEDPSSHPHLGIQLVTIDGPLDDFHLFVEALQGSSQLIQEYNTLKRLHEGADMERYRAAKDAFVERVLASVRSRK
jgi:GrpB-like predicted nucleotidyltransferase (UPF0157 family)